MTPRLSVCIATLNRAEFIGETLESIGVQLREGIEIVVVDGASKDDTEKVVRDMQARFPAIRYVRLERNNGVDRDFNTAVELAAGEYCWLMSDDDLAKPGAIDAIMRAIDQGCSLAILNTELVSFDLATMIDPDRLRFGSDRTYRADEFDRLFEETSAFLTYIGAVVIKRELWLARNREAYFGSYFIHVGVIFQAPLPGPAIAFAKPLISVRFGNTQWRPREFQIRMVCWTELIQSLTKVTPQVRDRCYPREPWTSIKSLFFYRAKGTYSLTEYQRWVRPRVSAPWDIVKAWAIAVFPGVLANLIGLAYCSRSYRDADIHFLDMKASRFYLPYLLKRRPS